MFELVFAQVLVVVFALLLILVTMAKKKKTVISINSYAFILLICFKSFWGTILYQITYSAEKSEIKNVDFEPMASLFLKKENIEQKRKGKRSIITTF